MVEVVRESSVLGHREGGQVCVVTVQAAKWDAMAVQKEHVGLILL